MNKERLHIGRAAQRIRRFHTMPTLETQTVGAHTFGVCLLLIELTDGKVSANLLKAALFHDMAEAEVGDTPSPTLQRFPNLKAAYKQAEAELDTLHDMHVELTVDEHRLLKLADRLELAFFALEDMRRGNADARRMLNRVLNYTEQDKLVSMSNNPEVAVWYTLQGMIMQFNRSVR